MLESLLLGFAFAALLILIFLDQCSSSRIAQLSAAIPGPRKLPFIGTYGLPSNGQAQIQFFKNMINSYGHVFKIWIGSELHVQLSDPCDIETIVANMDNIEKGVTYNFLRPWLGSGLLTSSGVKWQMRRKAITPTFHFKILEEFIEVFNKNGHKLVQVMEEKVSGDKFDLLPYISNHTLDIICETAMGVEVHAQGNVASPYIATVKKMLDFVMNIKYKCRIVRKLIFFFKMEKERDQMLKTLHNFTMSVIKDKRQRREDISTSSHDGENTQRKTAFLELLINLSEKPDSSIKTNEDIREEVDTFMFEGHDTTSSALCSTLMFLGKHQDVQAKVFEESLEFIPHSDYDLTYNDLQGMKYTEMVIKEALRLYPPVPAISRTLTKDTKLPSGYTLPAGTVVSLNIYSLHRNLKYFPNPEQFNPDNFLIQNTTKRHAYAFIPFSAGPRNCIGQKFAMAEMKTTVAKLVYNYKLIYGGNGTDIEPSAGLIFKSVNGYYIKLSRRHKNENIK